MVASAGYGGTKLYMYYQAKAKIDTLLAPVSLFFDVSYEGISTSVFGPVGVKGLRLRSRDDNEEITFGKVTLEAYKKEENATIPAHIHVSLNDVRLSAHFAGENKESNVPAIISQFGYGDLYRDSHDLASLGYSEIIGNFYFEFFYDQQKGDITVKLGEEIESLADIDIILNFTGVVPGMSATSMQGKINKIFAAYKDNSFVDRLIEKYAKRNNMDIETYRKQLVAGLDKELANKQIDLGEKTTAELKAFLTKPGKLTISMRPHEPVDIDSLKYYKPGDLPDLLNLHIVAE